MKACENCDTTDRSRVNIGDDYKEKSFFYKLVCLVLIYLPLLTLPFVVLSAGITYLHLKMLGAKNLRPYKSFVPDRKTHRYTMKTQITMEAGFPLSPIQSKLFWIANCTWYCPYSVALFEWHAYMVKMVENWWCPFRHNRKDQHYQEGAISRSYWHLYPEDVVKLDPEDRDNPIWNAEPGKDA